MKAKPFHIYLAVSSVIFASNFSWASTVSKANTYTLQANTTDWSATPATTDVGSFTGTLDATHAAGLMLGGNLSIGSLLFNNTLTGPITIGSGGTAIMSFAAGAYYAAGTASAGLEISAQSGSNGTLNLDGGILVVPSIWKNSSTGTLNLNGGTLKANRSLTTFMTGLTAANVKGGGAVIDDGGFAITIGQALLTDTVSLGGGLTKKGTGTLTLATTPTYTGTTAINAGSLALGLGVVLNNASSVSIAAGAISAPQVPT